MLLQLTILRFRTSACICNKWTQFKWTSAGVSLVLQFVSNEAERYSRIMSCTVWFDLPASASFEIVIWIDLIIKTKQVLCNCYSLHLFRIFLKKHVKRISRRVTQLSRALRRKKLQNSPRNSCYSFILCESVNNCPFVKI